MFSTIVVGTDGSETANAAVGLAVELARQSGATLHIVSAPKGGTGVGGGGVSSGDPVGAGAFTRLAADSALEEAAAAASGLEVVTAARSGAPATVLVDYAGEVGADLIVVGSRGMQGTRRIIGSVPNSVAHNAPCHVLIAKTA
jgi:nucleotide-binding universal stress UspA family protein